NNQYYSAENLIFNQNPECDYLVSTNQSPFKVSKKEDEADRTQKKGLLYFNENSRSIRIKNLMEGKERLNLDDLKLILADTKILRPLIRNVDYTTLFSLDGTKKSKLGPLIRILKRWDGNADLNSEGAALFSFLHHRYKTKYYVPSKNPDAVQ